MSIDVTTSAAARSPAKAGGKTAVAEQDGPNVHKYPDASFVTSWTIVHLTDPESVDHVFHVPTAILDSEHAMSIDAEALRAVLYAGLADDTIIDWWDTSSGNVAPFDRDDLLDAIVKGYARLVPAEDEGRKLVSPDRLVELAVERYPDKVRAALDRVPAMRAPAEDEGRLREAAATVFGTLDDIAYRAGQRNVEWRDLITDAQLETMRELLSAALAATPEPRTHVDAKS